MIDAYVDGRPMPSRSSSFTRLASEKRGGGSVKCCDGVMFFTGTLSPTSMLGSGCSSSSALPCPSPSSRVFAIERLSSPRTSSRCRSSGTDTEAD